MATQRFAKLQAERAAAPPNGAVAAPPNGTAAAPPNGAVAAAAAPPNGIAPPSANGVGHAPLPALPSASVPGASPLNITPSQQRLAPPPHGRDDSPGAAPLVHDATEASLVTAASALGHPQMAPLPSTPVPLASPFNPTPAQQWTTPSPHGRYGGPPQSPYPSFQGGFQLQLQPHFNFNRGLLANRGKVVPGQFPYHLPHTPGPRNRPGSDFSDYGIFQLSLS